MSVCVTLTPPHLSSRYCHQWGNTEVRRSCEANSLRGYPNWNRTGDSASSPYLERERLSSHYAARGPGALQSWTPQVLTLLRRQSVGRGPHQAPKLVGGWGRKKKAPSKYKPLPPGQQRTASWRQYWKLTREATPSSTEQSLTWDQQPSFK